MSDTQFLLGKLIEGNPQRDAVHIAVAPVVAAHVMEPGQRVGFVASNPELVGASGVHIGIIDPFLTEPVHANQKCWLYLFPNTITSLHHLWTHPAFKVDEAPVTSESEKWIRDWVATLPISYEVVMDGARNWVASQDGAQRWGEEYLNFGGLLEGYSVPDDFWPHYEKVKGEEVPEDKRGSFFTCSC